MVLVVALLLLRDRHSELLLKIVKVRLKEARVVKFAGNFQRIDDRRTAVSKPRDESATRVSCHSEGYFLALYSSDGLRFQLRIGRSHESRKILTAMSEARRGRRPRINQNKGNENELNGKGVVILAKKEPRVRDFFSFKFASFVDNISGEITTVKYIECRPRLDRLEDFRSDPNISTC